MAEETATATEAKEPKEPEKEVKEASETKEETFDKDRALATIRTQREAEKKLKDELKAERDARKKLEDAQLSEAEKKDKRIEELEGKLYATERSVQDAFLRSAIADSKHKVASVGDAALLLRQAGIEFDDEAKPKNLDSNLEALLKDKPYLRAQGGRPEGDADAGKGSGTEGSDFNAVLREKAKGR